jgi:hypothetical protein
MKIIRSDTAFLTFQRIFEQFKANGSSILAWQSLPDKKIICLVRLHSYEADLTTLHFKKLEQLDLSTDYPLYFYSEEGQLIFKCDLLEHHQQHFISNRPQEIGLLLEADVPTVQEQLGERISTHWKSRRLDLGPEYSSDFLAGKIKSMAERSSRDQIFLNQEFNLSVDEEDKLFAGRRESPRSRPKVEKWVKLKLKDQTDTRELKLFDLSRGGMSFISSEPDIFLKDIEIEVIGFDHFDLDDPLLGTIVAQRPLDDAGLEFKIGVQFMEGQG